MNRLFFLQLRTVWFFDIVTVKGGLVMKKKDTLVLFFYCIPWIFLVLYADYTWSIAWQYGVVLTILAVSAGVLADKGRLLIPGNLLSLGISLVMVRLFGFGEMNDYFKPFTAYGWVTVLTAASCVMQILVWKKNQRRDH
jgi:hypothetical protein